MSEIVLFQDAEGKTNVNVRLDGDTVWLTQKQMSALFDVGVPTINWHLKNIYEQGEVGREASIRENRIDVPDGRNYNTQFYNLDAIISVGYRVNSMRATQFRQWATQTLNDHLVKGLSLNHQRLAKQCLAEAQELISLLSRALLKQENLNEESRKRQVLALISKYAKTWTALAQYDEDKEKDQGFIEDEYAAQKNKNRLEFGELIKRGLAKATDASMFHGLAAEIKVKYGDESWEPLPDAQGRKAFLLLDHGNLVAILDSGERLESNDVRNLAEQLRLAGVTAQSLTVADWETDPDHAPLSEQIVAIKSALLVNR